MTANTSEPTDLLILGAGPAGVGAALAARSCGLRTVVVDTACAAGGQVYRAPPPGHHPTAAPTGDAALGDVQRSALAACGARTNFEHLVWSVGADLRVDAMGPAGAVQWRPRSLLVAAGATERVTPFPGWTAPGVIGLAAATLMLKSQHLLPGQRTLVAGCGPLLAAVANAIVSHGGEVAAVVDTASRVDWLRATPALLWRPADLALGLRWRRRIQAAGVPWVYRHAIRAVEPVTDSHGNSGAPLLRVEIGAVAAGGRALAGQGRQFQVDCVTVGDGLIPATDVTRLLRAVHDFDRVSGGWVPRLDADQRTSVERLYAAGDGCGINGARAAHQAGHIAGFTAALDLGAITATEFTRLTASHRRARSAHNRFGRGIAQLIAQRPGQVQSIPAEAIVCRCEDLRRADIDAALAQGARDVNQLKSWTRCGMGPCQGRICGDTVAQIVAAARADGNREHAGVWTPRVPLRPLDMEILTGHFDYADIAVPEAAPL